MPDWTREQRRVIDARNQNLLVSAGAGAGKTAVLVERMMNRMMDKEHPVDVDRFLLVTFTKAAAFEMRERIGETIENKMKEEVANDFLAKQLSLLPNAQIMTIDSFCYQLVKAHFLKVGLDPNFRIGDESELTILKEKAMQEVLEEAYEQKSPEFLAFVESFVSGKTDAVLEEMVENLYEYCSSDPRPEKWLERAKELFSIQSREELSKEPWIQFCIRYAKERLAEAKELELRILKLTEKPGGPYTYSTTVREDISIIDELLAVSDFDEMVKILKNLKFPTLARKKDDMQEHLINSAKELRETVKKIVKNLGEQMFAKSLEGIMEEIRELAPVMNGYIEVCTRFLEKYLELKQEKNCYDFSDVEHFALDILIERYDEDGSFVPSDVAQELSDYYEEIMIDEYQDSNYIQEYILSAIAKNKEGQKNRFMVGDVKQSIYKFRMAKPEIFMSKYHDYKNSDKNGELIELRDNFRSRHALLMDINHIFKSIMKESMGGIEYDDSVALATGFPYPETVEKAGGKTELMVVIQGEETELSQSELEARMIANKIKEMLFGEHPQYVYDKKKNAYRKAMYKDVVILLRGLKGWSDVMEEVLLEEQIPCFTDSSKGYFQTMEVKTMLAFLNIIDNRYIDIELVTVLKSPIVGLSSEELAKIKIYSKENKKISFFERMELYAIQNEDILSEKIKNFLQVLDEIKHEKEVLSLGELIHFCYEKTGYLYYVRAMEKGEIREGNLYFLMEKAKAFEKAEKGDLFHFLSYMRKIREHDVDFGEAKLLGDEEDVVRIMSIHKSKGLEFPICFVSGLGRKFNQMDLRKNIVIHPDFYLAGFVYNIKERIKEKSVIRSIFNKHLLLENLAEEIRILYVAMTRGREKLILTGCQKKCSPELDLCLGYMKKETEDNSGLDSCHLKGVTLSELEFQSSYLDWILSVLSKEIGKYEVSIVTMEDLVQKKAEVIIKETIRLDKLKNLAKREKDSEEWKERKRELEWNYPFYPETIQKGKYSVSELKKLGMDLEKRQEEKEKLFDKKTPEDEIPCPDFLAEKEGLKPAKRGTLVHKLYEMMDFQKVSSVTELENAASKLVSEGKISKEILSCINFQNLYHLFETELGKRMKVADEKGKLFKEAQFMSAMPMSEIDPKSDLKEMVLVQGVIDLYFEEEDGLVLVDYKTDRAWGKLSEEYLIKLYKDQIWYYKKVLEQLTGKKVKETYIYSFTLEKEIKVDFGG